MQTSSRKQVSRLALTLMFGILSLGAVAPLAGQQASDVPPVAAPSLINPPLAPTVAVPSAVPMGPRYAPLVESIRPAVTSEDNAQPNSTVTISTVGLLLIIIIVILIAR